MCMYVYVCVYVCVRACVCACGRVRLCVYTYKDASVAECEKNFYKVVRI